MRWLDDFLSRWPGTPVVTSHDRYFLDRVVNRVWRIDGGRMRAYRGNYSQFERQRDADQELLQKQAAGSRRSSSPKKRPSSAATAPASGRRKPRAARSARPRRAHRRRREGPALDQLQLKAQRSGDVALTTEDLEVGYTDTLLRARATSRLSAANASPSSARTAPARRRCSRRLRGSWTRRRQSAARRQRQRRPLLAGGGEPRRTATVYEEMRRDRVHGHPGRRATSSARFLFSGDDVDKHVISPSAAASAAVSPWPS